MKLSGNQKKKALVLFSFFLLLLLCVGGTAAYLHENTSTVTNSFKPAQAPTPVILETFTEGGTEKKDVKVKLEGGDGAYYVRAAVIFTLQDDSTPPNTLSKVPADTDTAEATGTDADYTVTWGTDWKQGSDGYWYYKKPVVAEGTTTNLINTCTTLNTDAHLVVDILAQMIQANPATAVTEAWGFDPASLWN